MISVIGFDDIDVGRLIRPQLTTIHQDAEKKGNIAAEMIINYLKGRQIVQNKVVLNVSIVERESVKDINYKKSI